MGSASTVVVNFSVRSGEAVVEIAVMELIIRSIIDPGSLVVFGEAVEPCAFASSFDTLANKLCSDTKSKCIRLLVTPFEGLVGAIEEDRYSPLIRFAEGTVLTGSSKEIISMPNSFSSIPGLT